MTSVDINTEDFSAAVDFLSVQDNVDPERIGIFVGGVGYYQEWGKEPIEMHPGDYVNIPEGVKHWHGAGKDSWFSHLAIEVPGEGCSNEWLEPAPKAE